MATRPLPVVSTQRELAEALEDRSDRDLDRAAEDFGVDRLLELVFAEVQRRFLPDRTRGVHATIGWDIGGRRRRAHWSLLVADGTCRVTPGAPDAPDLTLRFALPDFLRFMAGTLDGMYAYLTGKLLLDGDLVLSESMAGWFRQGD